MKIILNHNQEKSDLIKAQIEDNDGYCCCALKHTKDTKCMCTKFREAVAQGYIGECDCGLYRSIPSTIYLVGDTKFYKDFVYWNRYFSKEGVIVLAPINFPEKAKITQDESTNLNNVHIQKIHVADALFVIDRYGEITPTLAQDINMAKRLGKKIMYASQM